MTDIMALGLTSIRSYTQGLATISDNVANAQTPGYARRSTRIEDGTVIRYADEWRNNESRIAAGLAEQASTRLNWLESAERALDDGETGIGQRVGAVFNRAEELAADPNSIARRSAYLQSIDDAAIAFRTTASGLKSSSEGIASQAQQTVTSLNSDLKGLLNINQTLLATPQGTSGYASLLDQRDRLLNDLSRAVPIDVSLDFRGVATVRMSGTGATLLNPDVTGQMSVTANANGTLAFTATQPDGTTVDVTPPGGSLAGMSSAAVDIAEQRTSVDALAAKFAELINSNQAAGRTKAGNPGGPLLDVGPDGALSIAALAVSVDDLATADGTADNANLIALNAARRGSGIEAGWTAIVSSHAQQVQSAKLVQASSQSRSEAAEEARDQLSGVDLDREAVELMRLQQSYEAAARVIQVAREMLQSINQIGG
jgi:flagellar hook-associated protein 1 FlgK